MFKEVTKQKLISELESRAEGKILEPTNFESLKKLIEKADTFDEAIMISELGTTYKKPDFILGQSPSIRYLPHHVSPKRPQMPMLDRAAQFSPFAALTGYDDSVKEAARFTDVQVSLSEYEMKKLNAKLQLLQEHIREQPEISAEYFQKDEKKDGGPIRSIRGGS